ncbi:transcriptional regulator, AraC family [Roseateles sp. YR242]|uniref:AraC family transcriptional regulator n=1 Tax=Roseateles sp. YR242 TaxID=1855305 RepID=UPI0008CCF98F|nr:AraC family transcriptional regulator [Roseateles sp. YR242]SEK23239.1 transcriptional regulator, AraC family [Roseateles sp. YR242]
MTTVLNDRVRKRIIEQAIGFSTGSFASASPVAGVKILHTEKGHARTPVLYEPMIVIVFQGAKVGFLGDRTFRYDPERYLLLTVPLPFECETIASPKRPFVGISIGVDATLLQSVLTDMGHEHIDALAAEASSGVNGARFTDELLCAIERLFDAMKNPRDARFLGKLIVKEILYHVLCGDSGAALHALVNRQTHFGLISKVIQHIETNYSETFSVEQLARMVNMSVSAFHHNFKAVTNTSPLQYVKSFKLHRARLIMLNEGAKAGVAATRVGYESASQFSREFKRYFGATPVDEVARLQPAAVTADH